ncbi:type II toxin-antitoxin system BrnA family antitoxin [Marinomonas posidonica]|uniref:type II toxin-antitoxin system BrnA family antitoxin n=1 Tax=Marinomonas posidonica TaxID=936476 RepID=UPI003735EF83
MKAKEFDDKFDAGEDLLEQLDVLKAQRPLQKQKRINVDIPEWMIDSLDKEARRIGVTRQSIIKVWLAERLEQSESLDRIDR